MKKQERLVKVYKFFKRLEEIGKTKLGLATMKASIFVVVSTLFFVIFPWLVLMSYFSAYESGFVRDATYVEYNPALFVGLLFTVWIVSLGAYLAKSIVLYNSHKLFGEWQSKGNRHYWNQVVVMPLLSIFVTSFFLLCGLSVTGSIELIANPESFFFKFHSAMSENETLIFITSLLSLTVFVVIFAMTQFVWKAYDKLDKWGREPVKRII